MDIKAEIDSRLREIERLKNEVDTLRAAAKILGAKNADALESPSHEPSASTWRVVPKRRGRSPGAISKVWRTILKDVYLAGGRHSYDDIYAIAVRHGVKVSIGAVRDRVRSMVKKGLMSGEASSGFVVLESTADRFGFVSEPKTPAPEVAGASALTGEAATSPNENPNVFPDWKTVQG